MNFAVEPKEVWIIELYFVKDVRVYFFGSTNTFVSRAMFQGVRQNNAGLYLPLLLLRKRETICKAQLCDKR